jgi:hypothetical protein
MDLTKAARVSFRMGYLALRRGAWANLWIGSITHLVASEENPP